MQFSFFSSDKRACKSPFSQENQFSITTKCFLPTSESAQCFIFIPSSNRSGLTPGTPENGTNKTLLFYGRVLKGSVFVFIEWIYFMSTEIFLFLAGHGLENWQLWFSCPQESPPLPLNYMYHSTETELPLRELTLRTLRSTCVDGQDVNGIKLNFSLPRTFLALHHAFLPRERPFMGRINLVPTVLSYSSLAKRDRTAWRVKSTLRGRPLNVGQTVLTFCTGGWFNS